MKILRLVTKWHMALLGLHLFYKSLDKIGVLSWDLDSAVRLTKDPCWILFFLSERKIGLNMSTFVRVSSRRGVNLGLFGNGVMLDS